jgi:hypothetical protein
MRRIFGYSAIVLRLKNAPWQTRRARSDAAIPALKLEPVLDQSVGHAMRIVTKFKRKQYSH